MPLPTRRKKKVRYRTGYKPTNQQLLRISALKRKTGKKKELIRDVAMDLGLAEIQKNPQLLEAAA